MRSMCLVLAMLIQGGAVAQGIGAQAASDRLVLAGRVPLARLIDLGAEQLGIVIEYDDKLLQGQTATLRGSEGLTNETLWALTNQLLVSHGLTTIATSHASPAGQPHLSVVKLTDAPGLARIEPVDGDFRHAGYAMVRVPLTNLSARAAADALKPLLSKPAGIVQELGGDRQILIGELTERLRDQIAFIRQYDARRSGIVFEPVSLQFLSAVELTAAVTTVIAARNALEGSGGSGAVAGETGLSGKVVPSGDGAVVIVAPQHEVPTWRALIAQFDRRSPMQTESYSASGFGLQDLKSLVDQVGREPGPQGSGDQWRVIEDPLTNVLIVTATRQEHQRIAELMDRLASIPAADRRPVRSFAIRNRNVTEIIEVLSSLLEAGVFEAGGFQTTVDPSDPANNQRDTRPAATVPSSNGSQATKATPTTDGIGSELRTSALPANPNARSPHADDASPPITLTADVGTNTLIAVGEPRMLAQIEELLKTLDVRQPQVMVEVLVVSLNESDTRDLGVELEKIELSGGTVIRVASLFGLGTPGIANPDQALRGQGFSGLILNPGDFRVLIRALQTLNNGRALNIPKVLVNNNQQATLDAVLQQPFVSTNASTTVATTSFGGFENAGTTVTVRPQIARGDHLVVEYAVMLSAFVGDSSDPGIPPPRQQNKLQSVVTIPDGYTVALGGIEVRSEGDSVSQIPLLGDIPFVGELFKNRSKSESVSKFFIFIRPSVMRHEGFEDLKFLSDDQWKAAEMRADDKHGAFEGWPEVKPQVIR